MSDAPAPVPAAPARRRLISPASIALCVLLIAAAGGYYLYVRAENEPGPVDEFASLKGYFLKLGHNQILSSDYEDANGDLVADAPKDPAKLQQVNEIGFSLVGTDDPDRVKAEEAEWAGFMAELSKATGLPVVYRAELDGPAAQMSALQQGRLQVTAFNTGAVVEAVNSAGFVPLFAPANDAGQFAIRMEILVKAGSPIQKPEELRGKTLGFVGLSSNSGAKLPMYVLKEKFGMLPVRDYRYRITGDYLTSMVGLAETNDYDAICVASDIKERALAAPIKFRRQEKSLKADAFRTIYASDPVPPLCFGVAYNLPPDRRAKIDGVFRSYRFTDAAVKSYAKQGKVRFAPVNYKEDWKIIRDVDTALSRFADLP
jgi:phosphonate transport system substrate-binding protein